MYKKIEKILRVVKRKEKLKWGTEWSESGLTYLNEMQKEIDEVKQELAKQNNSVYLEDELADLIWDYLNAVRNISKENPDISLKKILNRCLKKFDERISAGENGINWAEIKKIQKKKLLKRHNKKYGNK